MSTVAIGQFGAGEDKTANLREIERLAQTAAENGAKMLLLPEYSMYYATHRKRRLYDAFGYRESDECRAGDKPFSPIETPVGKLGIITCFELRFPALAAEQRARGAETLFVPAGWVQGENKLLHWRTLLCARAIENGRTGLGGHRCAPGKVDGESMAMQTDGTAPGELGEEQDLLIVKIN